MRSELVIKAAVVTTGLLMTIGLTFLLFKPAAGNDYSDSTGVAGVTMTAPDSSTAVAAATSDSPFTTTSGTRAGTHKNSGTDRSNTDSSSGIDLATGSADRVIGETDDATSTPFRAATTTTTSPKPAKQPGGGGGGGGNTGGGSKGSALEVKGSIAGLYPGHTKSLPLTFENKNNFAVHVVEMTISATGPSGCNASNLALPTSWTSQRVEANSERTVTVPVALKSTAGNSCAGASFNLTYSGKAVKA